MEICLPGAAAGIPWLRRLCRFWNGIQEAWGKKPEDRQPCSQADRQELNRRAGELLESYGDCILRLAWSYLHNSSDAEEIVQDTLIRYLQAAPQLESPAHEKAWLLRVAANLSKNRIRYNRLREADPLSEELVSEGREDLSFVWEAVKALPVKYREVIHLYYQEGYSTQEIAEILGRSGATVRSDLYRGRQRLRGILKEAYDFDEGL